ncbi:SGNH/GDSL hydrolase family protein [uncultured Bacteroides sp.]|uniref:SGNH/GDSL hydrolase family protein n=1 Tax=uncultured Bacteroides sp. TaxID=162156 RepID=UPI00262B781D|nr:SGNH/GDSL hydrolase family protein [uncultured Bacteroides sp.]
MNTKPKAFFLSALMLSTPILPLPASARTNEPQNAVSIKDSQWNGKKVAFLGDSITDKIHVGTTKNYWQYLAEMLGIEPLVYGINGNQWNGVLKQAQRLNDEVSAEPDAIIVFAGTNDYNAGIPLGEWFTYADEETTVKGGGKEVRKKRTADMNDETFRGRINKVMSYLKEHFPEKQIIVLTPIHRAYAEFKNANIQPEESFPNKLGLYIDDYVNVIKEAANVWAVPVIDLNSISGLYPLADTHARYFHDEKTDRLHPNANGHYRMAKAIAYQLLAFPADFR